MLTDEYTFIGSGTMPVLIFVATAVIFHIALRYTKYGKYTYAIGGKMQGFGGIITSARAVSAPAAMGGTSLSGGLGTIGGAVVGTLILGVMISGFTFLGVDAYIQDIVKGVIIVAAVTADQYRRKSRKSRKV
jgi:inositol transport system permease protein